MSKPYGMTAMFQIVKPTHVEDAIYEAVEAAIFSNMTVEDFRRECASCWGICLRERAKDDEKEWAKP